MFLFLLQCLQMACLKIHMSVVNLRYQNYAEKIQFSEFMRHIDQTNRSNKEFFPVLIQLSLKI